MRHWAAATLLIEQAALACTLAKLFHRLFPLKVLYARASGLSECFEKCLRPLQFIQQNIFRATRGNSDENLSHPVGMRRATRYVDNG